MNMPTEILTRMLKGEHLNIEERKALGVDLLKRASDACTDLNIRIRYRHYPGSEPRES